MEVKEKEIVFLRLFELNDFVKINRWRNDPEIQSLISGTFRYVSVEMEKEWVRQKALNDTKDTYFAICLNDENREMIGYISVNDINYINRSAHAGGIVIGERQYQDGEVMHEAQNKIREFVFDHLNLNRLTGSCLAEHKVSRIMMEASGFKLEGIMRQAIYKNGKYHDSLYFSLLRSDYYQLREEGQYSFRFFAKRMKLAKESLKRSMGNSR